MQMFVQSTINKIYLAILVIFSTLLVVSCEKEPVEPFTLPVAVDPTEIAGEWNITKFY